MNFEFEFLSLLFRNMLYFSFFLINVSTLMKKMFSNPHDKEFYSFLHEV